MKHAPFAIALALLAMSAVAVAEPTESRQQIPDKLVVLTFDDGNASDIATVAPILKEHGFGATFFITSGWLGRDGRMNWRQIVKLQSAGFEIGCHTVTHPNLLALSSNRVREEIAAFDRQCAEHGVKKATSFSYPGGHFDRRVLAILDELGYVIARRGRDPELPLDDNGGNGRAYVPGDDHPFLIPSTMTRGIGAQSDEHIRDALSTATDGAVAVLTYHGVPDLNRHCSTQIERFRADMQFLKDADATVISIRDLSRYVDLANRPEDAFAPIVRRLGLGVHNLTCDPAGRSPTFNWKVAPGGWKQEQSAYRILVASSTKNLKRDHGDLWDSAKLAGNQAVNVPYSGKPLELGKDYWWKVQVWNRRDGDEVAKIERYQCDELISELKKSRSGPFSEAATFTVGSTD